MRHVAHSYIISGATLYYKICRSAFFIKNTIVLIFVRKHKVLYLTIVNQQ